MIAFLLLIHSSSFRGVPLYPSSSYNIRYRSVSLTTVTSATTSTSLSGLFDFFDGGTSDDNNSIDNIPVEIRNEITLAESKTTAAKDRQQRIILYFSLTLIGITIAFGNAFLSDLRYGDGSPSTDLSYYGFGWVQSNFITRFVLTNKIGGALGLLGAGVCGTLAEVEIRSKKESIEKIWTEMQRRRQSINDKEGVGRSKKKRRLQSSSSSGQLSSNRRDNMTGKQKKRLSALEEVLLDTTTMDDELTTMPLTMSDVTNKGVTTVDSSIREENNTAVDNDNTNNNKNEGILGAIAGFYKKADSMAASQALLLNKELEDRGIIEKITDETGLKVVGKKKAAKAAAAKSSRSLQDDDYGESE
jgi:hypothetical protein